MTPQKLKNSILQLAFQGKLVEQRPEEGTAAELYKQIQAEKQALIKAGKIKKEKPLPEIAEDEVPFEIPESWIWVRLGSIVEHNPKNDLPDDLDAAFIPMTCVMDGYKNEHTFEIKKWGEIKKGFTQFADGDIGVAKITPCFQNRKSVIFQNLINGFGAGTTELSIIRIVGEFSLRKYLLWFFKSEYFIVNGMKSFTGTAGQQRIHKDYLSTCVFPLPPFAEQKRIVAKIEELLPLIERYEKAWTRLEDFNKRFPGNMQKSILQVAIQGKLVEQHPEEGTGEELYKQIQAEKQALIKAGKIKKEKPLPEIAEDEIPFEIPESWKWVRLGSVGSWSAGATPPRTNVDYYNGNIPWLKTGDLNDGYISTVPESISELALEKTSVRLNPAGSVLMAMYGATIGKLGILNVPMTTNQACCACIPYGEMYNKYLFYYLLGMRKSFIKMGEGGAQPNISKEKIVNAPFPLPPLAEQKRIVARLEELLPLCERLKH